MSVDRPLITKEEAVELICQMVSDKFCEGKKENDPQVYTIVSFVVEKLEEILSN